MPVMSKALQSELKIGNTGKFYGKRAKDFLQSVVRFY